MLSALVHPWFYGLVAFELTLGMLFERPQSLLGHFLWSAAWFDLIVGYVAAMALAFITTRARGYGALLRHVPLMPVYWLLISGAAYRALWQFWTAPFKWEKTEHGLTRSAAIPAARRNWSG